MSNNKTLDEVRSALIEGLAFVCLLIILATGTRGAFAATSWSAADYDLYPGNFTGPGTSQTGLLFIAKDPSKDSGIVLSDGSGPNVLWQTWPSNYLGINWSSHNYNVIVADFNHDGRADILLQAIAGGGTSYLLLTDTTGHVSGPLQPIAANALGIAWTADQHHLVAGDFNGDGYTDLFFQSTSRTGTDAIVLANPGTPNNVFSSGPAQTWSDGYLGLNWSTQTAVVYAGNFDGDQYTDLLVQARPNWVTIDYDVPFPVPVYPPNLNGVVFSLGGSTPFPSSDTRVTTWSRYAYGVDWSPLTANVVIGQFTGTTRSDIVLQALHSSGTSYLLAANGTTQVFGSTPTAISSSAGMSADQTRLIVTNFTGSSTGLYYQAVSASGTNYVTNNVGATTTATAASNYSPGSPTGQASSLPLVAGSTAGTFSVNASGNAAYSIPLSTPPGVGSLHLQLALSYQSGGANGTMGMGWSISGLSAITRCARTVAQDGYAQGITLTTSDRLCYNGQQLKLTGGGYGQPGSTYATESESFSLITAGSTSVGNGPASFTVTTKNGLVYKFGTTTNSQIMAGTSGTIRVWALSQIADRVGNAINFTYYNDTTNGSYRVYQILYPVTASGQGPYYTVTFSYSGRPVQDVPSGYIGGYLVQEPNQLNSIAITAQGGAVIKTYNLSYTPHSNAWARTTLAAVQECSASNCLSPTAITYQSATPGWSTTGSQVAVIPAVGCGACAAFGPFTGDFDGDGRTDIVYVDGSSGTQPATLWNLTATLASASGYGQRVLSHFTSMPFCPGGCGNQLSPLVGSVLGNGREQILIPQADPNNGNKLTWFMYDFQGGAFVPTNLGILVNGEFTLADVDGDGLPDLLSITSTGMWARHNIVGQHTSAVFASAAQQVYAATNLYNPLGGEITTVRVADFNGDGLADIMVPSAALGCGYEGSANCAVPLYGNGVDSSGNVRAFTVGAPTTIPANNTTGPLVTELDWNGDGCTDLLWGTSTLYLSNCGTGFTAYTLPSSITANITDTRYISLTPVDWDGDGRQDILYLNVDKTLHVIRSTGGDPTNALDEPTGISDTYALGQLWFVVDQAGDGRQDLASTNTGEQGSVTFYPHNGGDVAPDDATSFTDGYGMGQSASYVPLDNASYYTKCTSAANGCVPATYPEQDYQGSSYVVSGTVSSDGTGTTYQNQFQYWSARRSLNGRGFEGFAQRQVYDSRDGTYAIQTLGQTFPYTGLVLGQQRKVGSTPLSSWTGTQLSQTFGSGFEQRYFPYLSQTVEQDYEIGAKANNVVKQTTTGYTYGDGYGNLTAETTTIVDQDAATPASPFLGQSWQQTVNNTYLNDTSSAWCVGLLTNSSAQNTVPAVSGVASSQTTQTRTDQYVPDTSHQYCRVAQHIQEPNIAALKVTTQFGFDSCGNTSSVAVTGATASGAAMSTRTTLFDFGRATGRCQLPEAITNANGETTLITYNYNFGEKATLTDANQLQTTWSQDGFGRPAGVTHPDGTSEALSYASCDKSNNFCGVADLRLLTSDQFYDSNGTLIRSQYEYDDGFERIRYQEYNRVLGALTIQSYVYDPLGRKITEYLPYSNASNGFKTYTYDVLNRTTAENGYRNDGSLDRNTVWTYLGQTVDRQDPMLNTTVFNYDVVGKLRRVTDPSPGGVSNYAYGAFGPPVQFVDPDGATSIVTYDVRGFRTQLQDADRGTWNFQADSLHELTGWTDAKNQSFGESYDVLGRILSRTEPEGTSTWTWGQISDNTASAKYVGSLRILSGPGYSEGNTNDTRGRLSTKTITTDQAYTYTYSYNSLGQVSTLAYPASPAPTGTTATNYTLQYGYSYGSLSSITDITNATAPAAVWTLNAANDYSSPTAEVLGTGANAISVASAFKPWTNEILGIQSGTGTAASNIQNLAYVWDLDGNLTSRQNLTQSLTESFTFDALNRLSTGTLNGQPDFSVSYDAAGNITQRTDTGSSPSTYTYGNAAHPHALISTSATAASPALSYTYDANGNVITKNGLSFSWASYNLPTSVQANVSGTILSSSFSYGPKHDRYKQVATYSNGTETTYYVGGVLEKMVSSTGVTYWRHYVHTPGKRVLIVSRNSDGSSSSEYVLADHLGSSDAVVNAATGAVTVQESFNPFGVRRGSNWAGSPSSSDAVAIAGITRHGFTFHEHLDNVALIHMGGRVYDPTVGRFLSADPIGGHDGDSQTYNPYSYVDNRPLTLTDPTGLEADCAPDKCPPGGSDSSSSSSTSSNGNASSQPQSGSADANYQNGGTAQKTAASTPAQGGADNPNGDKPESGSKTSDKGKMESVTVSAKKKPPPVTATTVTLPLTVTVSAPRILSWLRVLPGAVALVVEKFAELGCGDSADSPSCKGSNTMDARQKKPSGRPEQKAGDDRPPPGSKGIDETEWSGDHGDIKNALGLGGADNVKISPNGDVWVEHPDGSWTNEGSAKDFTGSGTASGQSGSDRERNK